MKTAQEIYTSMLQIEIDLENRQRMIIGSPQHDLLNMGAQALAIGRLQNLLQVCMTEGVTPSTQDGRMHPVDGDFRRH